jgi:hypothetical protein
MSIKLALLKTGETLISDIKELVSDDTVCGYLLHDPQLVSIKKEMLVSETNKENNLNTGEIHVALSPWIILSNEKQIPVNLESVITLVDPVESLKKMYEDKINV